MPVLLPRKSLRLGLVGLLLLAGCSAPPTTPTVTSTKLASEAGLVEVTVTVPDDLNEAPFDEPRKALVPKDWTLSVWARLPRPRLAVWAPVTMRL